MFVTKEELELIAPHVEANNIDKYRNAYRNGEYPRADTTKDVDKRFRWDLLNAVPSETRYAFFDSVYGRGGNDTHVDTALRQLVKPL